MGVLKEALKLILHDLSTPSDFHSDWYGWATNQMAHITLGIMLTAIVSCFNFLVFGEFAYKAVLWGVVATTYILFVEMQQGKSRFWDSVEDFVFVVIYGAGTSIMMFHEVAPGSPEMRVNITSVAPICVIVTTHLIAGSLSRAVEQVRKNGRG